MGNIDHNTFLVDIQTNIAKIALGDTGYIAMGNKSNPDFL